MNLDPNRLDAIVAAAERAKGHSTGYISSEHSIAPAEVLALVAAARDREVIHELYQNALGVTLRHRPRLPHGDAHRAR